MIDKILSIYEKSNFDFKEFSHPNDELRYLFEDWLPYYRMKFAICKVLAPKTILEIGVRYGYSAITFLKAAPEAKYLGIDNDTDSFGGSKGAIGWAKKITKDYKTTFLIADTQEMTALPGEHYDLIHIDGQQDGDGTFHDLELALPKAEWILLDGFHWSKENMLSATYFIEKYRQFIEHTITIPSYAGELLIKTKESAKKIPISRENYSDKTIREEYDQTYFLRDCGGYDSFKKYRGTRLTDERLRAALYIAKPKQAITILDIGCGRGELCYALAQAGPDVTGIDYSPSAIAIAEKTFQNERNNANLKFICDDFLTYRFAKKFDRIIATDFIEHIEKKRYDQMLETVAGLLKTGGYFIIHTSPNALNYAIPYDKKRAIARSTGSYLPKNPRSYYEDIMHINEQTPDLLEKNLEKHFRYSVVWVATAPDITGSLSREFSVDETMNARSIFAVASHSPLDPASILSQLRQNPLDTTQLNAKISVHEYPAIVSPEEHFFVYITIKNLSEERWASLQPNPVFLTYHWVDNEGNTAVWDGVRTGILYPLMPGESRHFSLDVIAPDLSGDYILQVTMVQEGCFWFESLLKTLPVSLRIKTKPDEK
jgi:2-polyprenyl-3-methyl-5-hydroxy-6-metoxy-1,4-benzoquinol methylase